MAKATIYKMNTQPTEWEKIFANDTAHRRLISNIYKQLMQPITKKYQQDETDESLGTSRAVFALLLKTMLWIQMILT